LQQKKQKPLYALPENLSQNDYNIGPDDTDENQRVLDRDKEQFQKFLDDIEATFGLQTHLPIAAQTVFDSFEPWDRQTGLLSSHAIQLLSESVGKLRQPEVRLEVIVWATMPSGKNLQAKLDKSVRLRAQVEKLFWLNSGQKSRIRYSVKPWLFSDAKRPVVSVVYSKTGG
jgi:hypothetical protein